MIHKRIVFGVNNQRRFGDPVQHRHGATLTIIVDSVGVAVNSGGDEDRQIHGCDVPILTARD